MTYPAVSTPVRLTVHTVHRNSRPTACRLAFVVLALLGAAGLAWVLRPVALRALGWLTWPVVNGLAQLVLPQGPRL